MVTLYTINNKLVKSGSNFFGIITEPPGPDPFDPIEVNGQIWSGKNLTVDDGGDGIYHKTVNYGRGDVEEYYYTWDAASRVVGSIDGWHLPTNDDWYYLRRNVGQSAICSDYGWSGSQYSNSSGFTALPAGRWDTSTGTEANFWTNTNSLFWYMNLMDMNNNIGSVAISVRLIKDS